ncbi:hypothetical protein JAO76_06390 [Pontibacter sp. BT310]|uniref:Uncharacterized protein n=1 Tax=Pontibacter populi TaxID=890055 RepID=A0ABS6X9I5_9BACT|nr:MULTISPECIES: hypothetical protein [Pontibacter]MBJ6117810.1 hypothetical protein [Pontibacter sp. BT310]MBR0570236.1 hypothetical protein [Microvirga sp. STS03]MBW3364662.1 hypothetical protein [Pontibacter populi]
MKKYLLFTAIAGVFSITACTLPRMALESSFQQEAEELPIEGRKFYKPNGKFSIGSYQVADVKRGWRNSSRSSLFIYENVEASQRYQLSVQDSAGQKWYIYAAADLQKKSLNVDGWKFKLAPNLEYYASYFTSPESHAWRFITADPGHPMDREDFMGQLSNGETTFTVKPVYNFEGSNLPVSEIIGYEFLLENEAQAAVQVLNGAKVWMKPELTPDTRMVLASAMASLLLYEKLNETVENGELN